MAGPLRLGIVGAGWAGTRIAQAASELHGEVVVSCLMDPDTTHVERVASELGVEVTCASLAAALDTGLDAVAICSPHAYHAQQALEAIAARVHVLVEKPMALTLGEADQMVIAADRAGVVLGVAENEVYEPWVDRLREVVEQRGSIGQLAFAVITAGHRAPGSAYPGRRSWLTDPGAGGTGSWVLHGIHTVATCRRILGDIATVFVREHRTDSYQRPDLEATMSALLTLRDGTPVTLVQTPEVDLGLERKTVTLYGDAGVLRADRVGWALYRAGVRPPVAESGEWDQGDRSAYALEVAAFAAAIRDGRPMPTSGRSERDSLAVVLAGLESLGTGLPVVLSGEGPSPGRAYPATSS